MKEDFPTLKCINLVFLIFRVETILLFLKPNKWFRKPVNHLKKKKKKKALFTGQRQCGEATVILFSDPDEAVVLLCAGSSRRAFVFVLNVTWWSTSCLPLSDCVELFTTFFRVCSDSLCHLGRVCVVGFENRPVFFFFYP